MQTLKHSTEFKNAISGSLISLKKSIVQILKDTLGLYFRQPLTKTLRDFNVIPIMALVYCASVCERIISLLSVATVTTGDLSIGLATVYLGFLGTVVAAFIRAAMDIRANSNS